MRIIIFIMLLSFYTPDSYAGDNSNLQAEAEKFFQDYVKGYNSYLSAKGGEKDISQATQHFHMPLMQFPINSTPLAVNSKEQLGKNLAYFVNQLSAKKVAQIKWEKISVKLLTDKTAVASNIARAVKRDGSLVMRIAAFYTLYRTNDGWKIATLAPRSLDNSLSIK